MNNQCKFCDSKNLEVLSIHRHITRKYTKVNAFQNGKEYGTISFPIEEILCLDCGAVFNSMSSENLEEYKNEKKYFD